MEDIFEDVYVFVFYKTLSIEDRSLQLKSSWNPGVNAKLFMPEDIFESCSTHGMNFGTYFSEKFYVIQ
ncbi:uncharacterized protein G2W53_016341 [Senna tora]|uniref:Uncharacterized protein n=1 Tax=Senna tora TaxID=362788 RepID=A0A834TPQ5_9FABA|nr:uncharacterized protein G2W53_016341 [Senna tora]